MKSKKKKVHKGGALKHVNPFGLTNREFQVFIMVKDLMSNEEISFMLDLSVRTVEGYKYNICTKLGVRTNLEIIKFAKRHLKGDGTWKK